MRRRTTAGLALLAALGCGRGDVTWLGDTRPETERPSVVQRDRLNPATGGSLSTRRTPGGRGLRPPDRRRTGNTLVAGGLSPRRALSWSDAGSGERPEPRQGAGAVLDAGIVEPHPARLQDAGPSPRRCALGATVDNSFYPLRNGQPIPLLGGSQANLILALAVATRETLTLDQTRIVVSAASEFGSTNNGYILGGPSPQCDADTGCSLLNLNLSTEPLVADPFDLANLKVVVRATITLSSRPYCEVEVAGRLRRAD